jgi:hypothetical protein
LNDFELSMSRVAIHCIWDMGRHLSIVKPQKYLNERTAYGMNGGFKEVYGLILALTFSEVLSDE